MSYGVGLKEAGAIDIGVIGFDGDLML